MEDINIISIGSLNIDENYFFKNMLKAKEEYIGNIKAIEDGEKYSYSVGNLKYKVSYLNIANKKIEDIRRSINTLLKDKKLNNHGIMYFINKFNKETFNECVNIIQDLSQDVEKNFLLIYVDDKKENKEYLNELNKVMAVNIFKIEIDKGKIKIKENKRKEFIKWILRFYSEEEKRKRVESYSNYCIKNIYANMLKIENGDVEGESIENIKEMFSQNIDSKLKRIVKDINLNVEEMGKLFSIKGFKALEIKDKEEHYRFDRSVLGKMALEANKVEEKTFIQKACLKIGIKKEERERKTHMLEKEMINEAFNQKKRLENIFKEFYFNI